MNYSYSYGASGAAAVIWDLLWLAYTVLFVIGLWQTFVKAGLPGWGAIIPFYNVYLMIKMAGRPGWWLVFYFIPLVNIVVWLIVALDIAKNFGQGSGFGILLWIFPGIMFLVLGFGNYQYRQVAHPEMVGVGYAGGQYAPPPAPPAGQYMPPTPGSVGQPMAPPPPLAQPVMPQPLAPPPSQAAPPVTPPPIQAAPYSTPPATEAAPPTTPPPAEAAPITTPPAEAAAPTPPPPDPAPPESPTPLPPPPVT
jgi:Family of unknown function (DUF5684)